MSMHTNKGRKNFSHADQDLVFIFIFWTNLPITVVVPSELGNHINNIDRHPIRSNSDQSFRTLLFAKKITKIIFPIVTSITCDGICPGVVPGIILPEKTR